MTSGNTNSTTEQEKTVMMMIEDAKKQIEEKHQKAIDEARAEQDAAFKFLVFGLVGLLLPPLGIGLLIASAVKFYNAKQKMKNADYNKLVDTAFNEAIDKVNALNKQVKELEAQVKGLQEANSFLKAEQKNRDETITKLNSQLDSVKKENQTLATDKEELIRNYQSAELVAIDNLEADKNKLEADLQVAQNTISDNSSEIEALKAQIENLTTANAALQVEKDNPGKPHSGIIDLFEQNTKFVEQNLNLKREINDLKKEIARLKNSGDENLEFDINFMPTLEPTPEPTVINSNENPTDSEAQANLSENSIAGQTPAPAPESTPGAGSGQQDEEFELSFMDERLALNTAEALAEEAEEAEFDPKAMTGKFAESSSNNFGTAFKRTLN